MNSEVVIEDNILMMKESQLVYKVTYSLDSSGSFTDIESLPKDGYSRNGYSNKTATNGKKDSLKDSWKDVK